MELVLLLPRLGYSSDWSFSCKLNGIMRLVLLFVDNQVQQRLQGDLVAKDPEASD